MNCLQRSGSEKLRDLYEKVSGRYFHFSYCNDTVKAFNSQPKVLIELFLEGKLKSLKTHFALKRKSEVSTNTSLIFKHFEVENLKLHTIADKLLAIGASIDKNWKNLENLNFNKIVSMPLRHVVINR